MERGLKRNYDFRGLANTVGLHGLTFALQATADWVLARLGSRRIFPIVTARM